MPEDRNLERTEAISPIDAKDELISSFGRYEKLELLGEGGMARVYKAFDPTLGRAVALKFIRGDKPQFAERLLMEARSQARIEHEYVCKVYETGTVDGKPFIAMQFIKGKTLTSLIRLLSLEQKVKLMKEVAEGVHAAHRAGLIHRDLKPTNIMVEQSEDGDWKPFVMDFGIAREVDSTGMTMPGTVMGSAWYMSPEQAKGEIENLDRRTDVYSLGATMYELFCGKPPFDAQSSTEALLKVITEDPVRLKQRINNIPSELDTIVSKCLEKEPSRRYDSARAVAEDLTRYLDGEPIHARPTRLTYRLYKKVRKHKALALTIVAATILTLILGSVAIRTKLQAKEQARLAQQFGEEAAKIESIMREAHLYPLHDLRNEKRLVRDRMKQIADEIKTIGQPAYGPGHYAIARGHLSLNEYSQALEHVKKAWDSGYNQPEVAYTLGLALGGVFQKEMEDVRRMRDPEEKQKKRTEIEKQYKEPALKALRQQPQVQSAEYIEALIAFYEEQWDKAIEKSNAASKKFPQLYEATLLKADTYAAMASEQLGNGNLALASEKYPLAQKYYEETASMARSDPRSYIGLCKTWYEVVYMTFYSQGGDITPLIQKSNSACDRAIQADSERADTYAVQLGTLWIWGRYKVSRGEDPTAVLSRAIEIGKNAIRIDPKNGRAYSLLGNSYLTQGDYETVRGRDANHYFLNAIDSFEKATKYLSNPEIAYGQIANVQAAMADTEMRQGKNPEKNYKEAMLNYEKAIEINPTAASYINYGIAYQQLMIYKMKFGENPAAYVDHVIAKFEDGIRLNPDFSFSYFNLASPYLTLAEYQIEHGEDPSKNLEKALNNCKKAISLNKEYADAYAGLGQTLRMFGEYAILKGEEPQTFKEAASNFAESIRLNPGLFGGYLQKVIMKIRIAEYQLSKKQSPANALNEVRTDLKVAQEIDPSSYNTYYYLGQAELLASDWAIKNHNNPEASMNAAAQNLNKARELNSNEPQVYAVLALYHLRLAEWQQTQKTDAQKSIQDGITMADKALALNPDLPEVFAIRALLNAQRSRRAKNPNYAAEAKKDWQKAISMNKALSRKYELKLN